jgi:hypothetical protein
MDAGFMQASPWGAAIGAATQLGAEALKPVATNSANGGMYSFDSSGGFTLNIGSGSAVSTATRTPMPSATQALQAVASGTGSLLSNPAVVVLIGVALFLYLKHK